MISFSFPQFYVKEVRVFLTDSAIYPITPIEEFCSGGSIAGFDEVFEKFKVAYCESKGNITGRLYHSHDVEDVGYNDGYCVGIQISKAKRVEELYVADCTCVSHEGGPTLDRCFVFSTNTDLLKNE
jgi:hypothetical protein